eukprot:jgi/Astpho2/6182/gw1.00088.185.1_t
MSVWEATQPASSPRCCATS